MCPLCAAKGGEDAHIPPSSAESRMTADSATEGSSNAVTVSPKERQHLLRNDQSAAGQLNIARTDIPRASLSATNVTPTLDSLPAPSSREGLEASVTHSCHTPPEDPMGQSPGTSSGRTCGPNSSVTAISIDNLHSQGTSLIESSTVAPYRKPESFTGQEHFSEEVCKAGAESDWTLPAPLPCQLDDAYRTCETDPVRKSSSEFSSSLSEETEMLYGNMKEFSLPDSLLQDSKARVFSACAHLGANAIIEARKGLSRVLNTTDLDIDMFRRQLRHCKKKAYEENYTSWRDDTVPCFALSYVQHPNNKGRDKFNDEQWENFKNIVRVFARNGITQVRVWLDQCLWLRDASQESWVHIGLLPYVLWPVISLGTKTKGEERTMSTYERVWPFLEELGGLWSLGVLITRETRDTDKAESRVWISHNARHRFEPEESMIIMFLNIFHGALDNLETGWTEDVKELNEMAKWNILCDTKELQIGSSWKEDLMAKQLRPVEDMFKCICMPTGRRKDNQLTAYLDAARKVDSKEWNGIHEWMSENTRKIYQKNSSDLEKIQNGMIKLNLVTDEEEEYQMLRYSMPGFSVWLLVCMDGRSSNFCRGRVAWTKVMQGEDTLYLDMSISGYVESTEGPEATQLNTLVVNSVLAHQFGREFAGNVVKAEVWQGEIAWQ